MDDLVVLKAGESATPEQVEQITRQGCFYRVMDEESGLYHEIMKEMKDKNKI